MNFQEEKSFFKVVLFFFFLISNFCFRIDLRSKIYVRVKLTEMEQFENFEKMSSSSDDCPCNLCERFIVNVRYI